MSYYRDCAIPKPEPRALTKKRRDKEDARDERAARWVTRQRDLGKCRVPGCGEKADHLHHIVYRSKSKKLRWRTENLCWLCTDHHRLVHAGEVRISGNADEELIIEGNLDLLRFRL